MRQGKIIRTKRNMDAEGVNPIATQYEPPVKTPPEEKKSHIGLYTLLVCCATFLCMVYLNAQMNDRLSKIESRFMDAGGNLVSGIAVGAEYYANQSMPFCYGYDQKGVKGFAVDERKVTTPCAGFENVTQ